MYAASRSFGFWDANYHDHFYLRGVWFPSQRHRYVGVSSPCRKPTDSSGGEIK